MTAAITAQTAKQLSELVASAIAGEKAYNVPGICRRYGLADGSDEEAFRSKFKYVISRIAELTKDRLLELARAVHDDFPSYALSEILDKITEASQPKISELTRRRLVESLHGISLSNRGDDFDFFAKLWPVTEMRSPANSAENDMRDHIATYYFVSDHPTPKHVLEWLDIYGCSQAQFIRFLEALADPIARDESDQVALVGSMNEHLARDGFFLKEIDRVSGSPLYAVRRLRDESMPGDTAIGDALAAFDPNDIHQRWQEALKRRSSDPRAAITLARTLLEDTCKWIIHEAGQTFAESDDLPALYRTLAKILKLAPDDHTEKVFKQILGSCQSIVESLGSIRNKLGDAHSQGPLRAKPQTRHAELAVNLAGTMATFLIATWEARSVAGAEKQQAPGA